MTSSHQYHDERVQKIGCHCAISVSIDRNECAGWKEMMPLLYNPHRTVTCNGRTGFCKTTYGFFEPQIFHAKICLRINPLIMFTGDKKLNCVAEWNDGSIARF